MDALHEKFMDRFNSIVSPLQQERAYCLQDRRFAFIVGAQWEDGNWYNMGENMIRVEVNKTAIGLKRIQDDYRANRVTVNFRAVRGAAEGTADLLDGLFRADVYRCKGTQAFDNAFLDGAAGGMGAWLLANEYEDEYDPENEAQRIRFDLISDADQRVFFDDNSRLYDKSDAQDCFVLFAMADDAFVEEYGKDKAASWPDNLVKPYYDWYQPSIVIVAWYYRVEETNEVRRTFQNVATGEEEGYWAEEIEEDGVAELLQTGWIELEQKKRKRRRVAKYVMSGAEMLEKKKYIAGDCIPVIPYYGQRSFIDNQERVQGHVRQAKDPQRIYNTAISKLTETNARSPVEIPIFDPTQVEGLEHHWADMNIKRNPYALAHALRDENGQILQTGPIGKIAPAELPPVTAALMQITANDIEQLTGGGDNADEVKSNVSAEAMDIAATRLDEEFGSYMDNFRQSMQRCGEVYLGMARDIYFEEGREVEVMDLDGNQSTEVLMQSGVSKAGTFGVRNDLSKGKFMVIADVTEATATRRDKTVRALFNIAKLEAEGGDQSGAQAALIVAIENMDGEGMEDYKRFNRKRGLELGLFQPTEEEQAEMAKAAEQQQQPDPAQIALLAQADDLAASAENRRAQARLNEAKIPQTRADTIHKLAQAEKLGVDAKIDLADTAMRGAETEKRIRFGFEQDAA